MPQHLTPSNKVCALTASERSHFLKSFAYWGLLAKTSYINHVSIKLLSLVLIYRTSKVAVVVVAQYCYYRNRAGAETASIGIAQRTNGFSEAQDIWHPTSKILVNSMLLRSIRLKQSCEGLWCSRTGRHSSTYWRCQGRTFKSSNRITSWPCNAICSYHSTSAQKQSVIAFGRGGSMCELFPAGLFKTCKKVATTIDRIWIPIQERGVGIHIRARSVFRFTVQQWTSLTRSSAILLGLCLGMRWFKIIVFSCRRTLCGILGNTSPVRWWWSV